MRIQRYTTDQSSKASQFIPSKQHHAMNKNGATTQSFMDNESPFITPKKEYSRDHSDHATQDAEAAPAEEQDQTQASDQENSPEPATANATPQTVASPTAPFTPTPPPVVTFGKVRAATTPSGMVDRISPRITEMVNVTVVGNTVGTPIDLSIQNANASNGEGTINGKATDTITSSSNINIKGTGQTQAGNGGKLSLVAKQGGIVLGTSNLFTIAAIPQKWSIAFDSLITGTKRGIRVNNSWKSDSGVLADLDEVRRSEKVEYGGGTGVFANIKSGNNSGFLSAISSPVTDSHSTPVSLLTGVGTITAKQLFIFNDARTGASNIAAKESGFEITRTATDDGTGNISLTTSKSGAAVSAKGYSSTAASGSVSRTQAV